MRSAGSERVIQASWTGGMTTFGVTVFEQTHIDYSGVPARVVSQEKGLTKSYIVVPRI